MPRLVAAVRVGEALTSWLWRGALYGVGVWLVRTVAAVKSLEIDQSILNSYMTEAHSRYTTKFQKLSSALERLQATHSAEVQTLVR